MSKWFYPDREILEQWIRIIKNPQYPLYKYFPLINEAWFGHILKTFELLEYGSYYEDDFHHKAAHIFYKICKNHHFLDSNKRSSIIVLYLFCLVNGYVITCLPEEIKKLATKTADIKGSANYEADIKMIETTLRRVVILIPQKTAQ